MDKQSDGASGFRHEPAPGKKPYTRPILVAWGTLRAMTRKVGSKGSLDGGSAKNLTKTR